MDLDNCGFDRFKESEKQILDIWTSIISSVNQHNPKKPKILRVNWKPHDKIVNSKSNQLVAKI